MRVALKAGLVAKQTPGSWEHITSQIGMFCYTGLTPQQSKRMTDEFHVYMLESGRINVCVQRIPPLLYSPIFAFFLTHMHTHTTLLFSQCWPLRRGDSSRGGQHPCVCNWGPFHHHGISMNPMCCIKNEWSE